MNARKLAALCIVGLALATFWAWIDFGSFALSVKAITPDGAFDLGLACAVALAALTVGTAAILRKAE